MAMFPILPMSVINNKKFVSYHGNRGLAETDLVYVIHSVRPVPYAW